MWWKKKYLITLALYSIAILPLVAAPVINEFMASNQSIYPDNCDFDDYSDWIELYNPDAAAVELTDYYLSDDPTLPLSAAANRSLIERLRPGGPRDLDFDAIECTR